MRPRPLGWSWHPEVKYPRKNVNGKPIATPAGTQVPASLSDIFADESIADAVMELRRIRRILEQARGSWNPFIPPVIIEELEKAEALLAGSIPHGLCPDCNGQIDVNDGCGLCMGQGWIPLSGAGRK